MPLSNVVTLGKINANCLWLSFLANKTINIFLIEILWICHFLLFTLLSQNQLTELNTFLLHLPFYLTPLASLALLHTLCTDWACSFRHCFSPRLSPTPPYSTKSPFLCLVWKLLWQCSLPSFSRLQNPFPSFLWKALSLYVFPEFCHIYSKHFSHLCVQPNNPHKKMFSISCLPL